MLTPASAPARDDLLAMYRRFCKDYPIITIEDPFDQDDWESTTKLTTEGVCQARCPTWPKLHLPCTHSIACILQAHSRVLSGCIHTADCTASASACVGGQASCSRLWSSPTPAPGHKRTCS